MKNKVIVDIVNFNADASCLSSKSWLSILKGGNNSLLMQWLNLYIALNKRIVLGFTGGSIADIKMFNPEAIALINYNPQIFEIISRPFAHDIAHLRLGEGFLVNFSYGQAIIRNEFINTCNYFLPPEFMLTNDQIARLHNKGVEGVFINSARFSTEIQARIPVFPYKINGLFGASLNCIPIVGELTDSYLHALHLYDCSLWNEKIEKTENEVLFVWRDGESSFLLPDGLKRENFWLQNEGKGFARSHIKDLSMNFISSDQLDHDKLTSYPVHSFSAWMKEFRMLGFLNRITTIESSLESLTEHQLHQWLMVINSDILSAIEKESPVVQLKKQPDDTDAFDFTIRRSDRGFEGEEYLVMLEHALRNNSMPQYSRTSELPYMQKWRVRIEYLSRISAGDRT